MAVVEGRVELLAEVSGGGRGLWKSDSRVCFGGVAGQMSELSGSEFLTFFLRISRGWDNDTSHGWKAETHKDTEHDNSTTIDYLYLPCCDA